MMSRHRGRSRPFAATRIVWPTHCDCPLEHEYNPLWSLFSFHVVRTVADTRPTASLVATR